MQRRLGNQRIHYQKSVMMIQGIGCAKPSVIDLTFSTFYKYQLSLGMKAIFCQGVNGGQVTLVVHVHSTMINQPSHANEQCAHHPNF
jgi:hypothetical protein